jgi:hypothetical protein
MSIEKRAISMQALAIEPSIDPNILFRHSIRIAISRFASSC